MDFDFFSTAGRAVTWNDPLFDNVREMFEPSATTLCSDCRAANVTLQLVGIKRLCGRCHLKAMISR